MGCEVDIYNNGEKALEFLINSEASYDMIIIDAEMPKFNGF